MKTIAKRLSLVVIPLLLTAFTLDTYEEELKNWKNQRIEGLKSEEGWLNLAGLFWLEEGENTLGGDPKNSIVFPGDHSEAFLGKIILKEGKVSFESSGKAEVLKGDEKVSKTDIFPYEAKPVVLKHKTLRWFIIKRGDKYAIRLRDLEGPYLKNFKGIESFQVDLNWKVKARFVPTPGKKLNITDITGRTYEQESPGRLEFTIDGKAYSLEASGSKERLHFVFGDLTNKHDTYGGGRFLDAKGPDAEGFTYLDFNKAYNPPCAFTPYATCPLPTKENKLPVAITSGEKYHGDH